MMFQNTGQLRQKSGMPLFKPVHLARCGLVVATGQAELIKRPREIHQFRILRKRVKAESAFQFLSAGIEGASLFRQTLQFGFQRLSFHATVARPLQGRQEIPDFALQGAHS